MFPILKAEALNESVSRMDVFAPDVARAAKPGQFIILRIDERGERIPLTLAGTDAGAGTLTLIYQIVGLTTLRLSEMRAGDALLDIVGPLGEPSHLDGIRRAAVVGGGLGVAIAYPQAKALHALGAKVDVFVGFRTAGLIILRDELAACSDKLYIMTDDGSNGSKGFVTAALDERLSAGETYDAVIAIGPLPMMKAVSELTRPYGVRTIVSMNPIMIDGTGMCGGCRVTVGGETKFACVDGPDFDGHLVDFDEAMRRGRMYLERERHDCQMYRQGVRP